MWRWIYFTQLVYNLRYLSILDTEDIVKAINYSEILLSLFYILMKYHIKIVIYYVICIIWNNADDGRNKNLKLIIYRTISINWSCNKLRFILQSLHSSP